MATIWFFELPFVALVGALLNLLGRSGNKRLRTSITRCGRIGGPSFGLAGLPIFGAFSSLLGGLAAELAIGL